MIVNMPSESDLAEANQYLSKVEAQYESSSWTKRQHSPNMG